MTFITRFAPSPTGPLHLGHAYSALLVHDMALAAGGEVLLRIEDLDTSRCRPEYEVAILDDLHWLGLNWPTPVMHQTARLPAYEAALNHLIEQDLCYPCSCTRRDIRNAISAPQESASARPDGQTYPGTCRQRAMQNQTSGDAIRLNMARALEILPQVEKLVFTETGPKHSAQHKLSADYLLSQVGDIVLARRDTGAAAYHLSVVVDDDAQNITDVIRGEDLFEATFVHRLLQALLNLPTPRYHHHRLIRDSAGKRLAKRDDARAIKTYREQGLTPSDIRKMVGL